MQHYEEALTSRVPFLLSQYDDAHYTHKYSTVQYGTVQYSTVQ